MSKVISTTAEVSLQGKMIETVHRSRGVHVPASVMEDLMNGKINTTECLLLTVIDDVSQTNGQGWCCVTNGLLGKLLGGLTPKHVSNMIARLTDARLMEAKTGTGGSRWIRTTKAK